MGQNESQGYVGDDVMHVEAEGRGSIGTGPNGEPDVGAVGQPALARINYNEVRTTPLCGANAILEIFLAFSKLRVVD